jgi:glycosyltransferase involved in cell wall biosynthesis
MKILHVLPYTPVPPTYGARLRVYNLLKQMVRNHDVTVVYTGDPGSDAEIRDAFGGTIRKIVLCRRQLARRVRGLSQAMSLIGTHSSLYHLGVGRELRRAVEDELDGGAYDIVQTEFPHMAFFDVPPGPVKILDAHNIEFDNFRRMWEKGTTPLQRLVYRNEYVKFYREEIEAFRRQDLLMFTSQRDLLMADAEVPEVQKIVIPNGVDGAYFAPSDERPEPFSMIFTGIMAYVPNSDGVLYFLDEVFPLILEREPRATITIVGSDPPNAVLRRSSRSVRVTGFVPDVRPYTHRAQVTVVPLRMGGGTRLKILESMSMMSPIVSTSVGAEGIDLRDGEHALIADEPRAFADAVLRLFADRGLRDRLTSRAAGLVRERYEWSVIGGMLDQVYGQAVTAGNGR